MSQPSNHRNAQSRQNVVVFFTDQQRWDSTGVHGNPLGLTPNFDRVAKSGTHCFNTYTCQPVCGPARASLQTGLYATNAGVPINGPAIREGCHTLGEYFTDAGYHTGYIGKWHLSSSGCEAVPPEHRKGYQYWLGSNCLEFTGDSYFTVLYDADGKSVELPGYRVDAVADAGIRYMADHKAEPFFLMMSFIEPHFQNHRDDYPAPLGYEEMYTGRWTPPDLATLGGTAARHLGGYWGMVKRLDEAYGRVMDALISLGLEKNTIVVFTTDHACHFKTRNSEYKRSCHESSTRIPLAFTGGEFTGGGEIRDLVSLVDLPPTLLDAAGIEVPDEMEGHSIMPLVRREKAERPDDVFIQLSEDIAGRAIRHGRWKYSVRHVNDEDRRNPSPTLYQEDFLYDLYADPYELDNRIGCSSLAEVTTKLRERLKNRIKAVEGVDVEIREAPEYPCDQRYHANLRPFDQWRM
jgi:arylsulfatase A-like enzyme